MAHPSKIVCVNRVKEMRQEALRNHLPAGFELVFADADTEEDAIAAVADADFIIASALSARVVQAAPKARLIQKIGEGSDRIDVAAATRLGVPVAKTSETGSVAVAELAVLLILATMRRLPQAHTSVIAGQWLQWELRRGATRLRGKRVGIVGLGKIGRLVAALVRGFEAFVIYNDTQMLGDLEESALGVRFAPLDELLRTSDVVTLHVPLTPSTRGLIGRRELSLMRSTAILVNSCRGAVVDEEALYEALRDKRLRGAGIDDYAKEPPGPNHPFFSLDNVVLTPHLGGGTEESEIEGVTRAYSNIVRVASGQQLDPKDIVSAP